MSGKSSPTVKCHWFSRFKKRISALIYPMTPAPAPPTSSRLHGDSTGKVDMRAHHDGTDLCPASTPHHTSLPDPFPVDNTDNSIRSPGRCVDAQVSPSPASCHSLLSSYSKHSTAISMPTHPSPRPLPPHLVEPVHQNYCQLPQGQTFTFQGPSHTFGGAHDFVVNNSVFNDYNTVADNFLEKLLQETIIGAEFDSSDRHPPPRCHPGTRLAIIERCLHFVHHRDDKEKLRWIVGAAGVGKSAVMQMITEKIVNDVIIASIFLSVHGRANGNKIIITVAYQLAVKCGPYHQFIRDRIALDPSLLRKSLPVQFRNFIVEPLILISMIPYRFLIVIDGLDECDSRSTQRELLELITDFCITYPISPVTWLIASRPEPHITSFFDKPEVQQAFSKEEMVIDSDEACRDVQRYLRDELEKIQLDYPTLRHKRQWPLEHEITKIASAAGGLFAYAATVVRYIGDPTYGNPAAQLRRVLETIDASAKDHVARRDHPMVQLDALYRRILSNVPENGMINTRKLMLVFPSTGVGFRELCNRLGMTEDDAYGAIRHLHAVMKIPKPDNADDEGLSYHHKSFQDFVSDFERSGFSRDFVRESFETHHRASLNFVEAILGDFNNMAGGEDIRVSHGGHVKVRGDNIALSWPSDERFRMSDEELRMKLCCNTVNSIHAHFRTFPIFQESISCFRVLTTLFTVPGIIFPFYQLREHAFDRFRDKLVTHNKLKQAPLRAFNYAAVCGDIVLQFISPTECDTKVSDSWSPSCRHGKGGVGHLRQWQGWSTSFKRYYRVDVGTEDVEDMNIPQFHVATPQQQHEKWLRSDRSRNYATVACIHCSRRFARHFINNPDLLATFLVDSTQMSYVEFAFVDPDDKVSEWRYRFLHSGPPATVDV